MKIQEQRHSFLYCQIGRHLRELGIQCHMTGYLYLCDSALLVHENLNLLYQLRKGLYLAVADMNDVSTCSVEKSMRCAIESAWKENPNRIQACFQAYIPEPLKNRPTSTEVIGYLNWKITMENLASQENL